VLSPLGDELGRVRDLTVRLDSQHPRVSGLLVAHDEDARLVPWHEVVAGPGQAFTVSRSAWEAVVGAPRSALAESELLLARDALDSQVVDLEGHRLSRVSEVLMTRRGDGALEVVAVDLGVAALLRRAGLAFLVPHATPTAVDWQHLHLTSPRGHTVQLNTDTAGMHGLDGRDLAELISRLSTPRAVDVVRQVGPERAAAALGHSHPHVARRLMETLGDSEARAIVGAAPASHRPRLAGWQRSTPVRPRRRLLRTAGWRVRRPPASAPRR
jgi:hypothetical protein